MSVGADQPMIGAAETALGMDEQRAGRCLESFESLKGMFMARSER